LEIDDTGDFSESYDIQEVSMESAINFTKKVRYELMLGREATQRIEDCPVAYLPIGCLERHGDHLPMGLDVIKAHGICCEVAQAIGGVVFPAHFYAGIHRLEDDVRRRLASERGNLYTDGTAVQNLKEILDQIVIIGAKVIVLYSGHYPVSQRDMIKEIAAEYNAGAEVRVIPITEVDCLGEGDHAGICETSFMLYLDRTLVDMTRISDVNYRDHGWSDTNSPELASAGKGETDLQKIIQYLDGRIKKCLDRI
jgi:creatinine amidohydrolase